MAVNKVVMNTENGEDVLIDLTGDSVTPQTLAKGATAHDASGAAIAGELEIGVTIIPVVMTSNQETATLQNDEWVKIQNDPCNTVIAIIKDGMELVLFPTLRISETYIYSTSFYADGAMLPFTATVVNGELTLVEKSLEIPTKLSQLTNDAGYLTSVPSEYVTETELNAKGYLTQHQSLSGYAKTADHYTKTESDNKYAVKSNAEEWLFELEDGSTETKKVVLA